MALMLALIGTLAACSDSFVLSPAGVAGNYRLTSINGFPVPTFAPDGSGVESGSLSLTEESTYLMSVTFTLQGGVASVTTTAGTYSLTEPSAIHLRHSDEHPFSGTIDQNLITVIHSAIDPNLGGASFVFER